MSRRATAAALSVALSVATASAVVAADPQGPTGHGAEVSAVAKAVETTQGNAHGKAVAAIASAHGKEVSAAAKAKAAEKRAAAKAKADEKSKGRSSAGAGNSSAADDAVDAKPSIELPSNAQPGGISNRP